MMCLLPKGWKGVQGWNYRVRGNGANLGSKLLIEAEDLNRQQGLLLLPGGNAVSSKSSTLKDALNFVSTMKLIAIDLTSIKVNLQTIFRAISIQTLSIFLDRLNGTYTVFLCLLFSAQQFYFSSFIGFAPSQHHNQRK